MITTYINETYRITHNAVNIVENALDNPNLVQISVANNCTILLAPQPSYGINYKVNGEYASWSLTGVNTRINKKEAHYIYARLNREDSNAMLVFSINNYTTDGKIVEDPDSAASENYYYIKVGSITATDAVGNEATVKREVRYDGGYLGTPQSNQSDESGWKKMFVLTADNLINALKHFASFTVQGTLNILGHLSINGKQISDVAREVDETPPEDDYTIPTLAYLKGKFVELLNRYFISKVRNDTTPYKLTIRGGLDTGWDESQAEPTGSISKDGILKYAAYILKEYISSPKFVPGFTGEGFKIYKDEYGNWHIECDILDVRKVMNVFELLIQKIRSINGALVISQANGKVSAVTETPDLQSWILEFEDEDETFQAHDLVRCQVFDRRTIQSLAFDFTKFTAYLYDGSAIDDSVRITNTSIEFSMNNSGNSGFQLYMYPVEHVSDTPIITKECKLEISGLYDGAMAVWSGLSKDGIGSDTVGGLLTNGENVIRGINASEEIYNLAIMIVLESGHGNGKVTVSQKIEDTLSKKGKYYWCEVASVNGNLVTIPKSEFEGIIPAVGDEVVQMGNTENPLRQSLIYMSATEDGKPKIELLDGVKTKSFAGTYRSILGDLDHITDPDFPDNMQPHGKGVYSDNSYLKGAFVFFNGKNVQTEIENAQTDASNAQAEANAAKDRLNKWANDGYISPAEKQQLLLEKKTISAEKSEINSDANRYNVNTVSYNSAYEAYVSQINQHTVAEPENIPVGPNLIPCQIDYYNNRTQTLNAIAVAVKAKTDSLETEMSAIPGKITLAIRSAKTSNVNLLLDSNHILNASPYQLGAYKYDKNLEIGKTYTLTVCYKCGEKIESIAAYNNPSFGWLSKEFTSKTEEIKSVAITPSKADGSYFYFYKLPNGTDDVDTYVKWAVITEGDTGTQQWIPSASEKITGVRNLIALSRFTDSVYEADFNTFKLSAWVTTVYKSDYILSHFKPSTDYCITGRFKILKKPTVSTSGYKDPKVAFAFYNGTTTSGLFLYDITQNNPGDIIEINQRFRTPSSLTGFFIIAYTAYDNGSTGEMQFYDLMCVEGIEPALWTQAPEDIEYGYKKYTDTAIEVTEGKIDLSVKTQIEKLNIGSSNILNGSSEYWFSSSDYLSNVTLDATSKTVHRCLVLGKGAFNCYKQWMPVDKDRVTAGKQYTVGIDVSMYGNYYHVADFWFNVRKYSGSTAILVADERVTCENKTDWSRYYVTVTIPQNENISDLLFLCGFTGNNNEAAPGLSILYKNINLVEGSVGSSWAPSAGDIYGESIKYTTSQIEVIEEQIKLKVDSTVVDSLGQTVKQQGSQILLNTQKIEQTVTKTEYNNGISKAEMIARYVSTGKMLPEHSDVTFKSGLNGLSRYNNAGNDSVTLHRASAPSLAAPNDSGYIAVITCKGAGTPGAGGFYFGNTTRAGAIFLYRFTAMIPSGKTINFSSNAAGDGYTYEFLTSKSGTGKWEDYVCIVRCGASGTFSSTGFFYVDQQGTFEWYLAYATCYDVHGDNSQITKTVYQTKITQLEESISLKATQTTVDGQISSVNNSISGINNNITGISQRLSEAEIKIQPDRIALTVREQGIGYGGTNYFGWGSGISKDIVGSGVYVTENRGTYGLQIACANTSATILLRYSQLGMNFKGPGKYTLSFKAKQQAGVAMDLNVNVCDAENFIITPSTTWQYYKKTFTVTRYTDYPYYGFIDFEKSGGATTQIIEFAEIMLEYGSEATQWRPAPFDTTAASGLLATGINISNGQIVLTADKTKFQNNSGTQIAVFDSNGINADLINAKKLSTAVSGKRIVVDPSAQEVQLYNENGNKVASIGFKQDDRISIPYIQLKDYSYTGSVLRTFDIYGGTLYSNETRYGSNYGYTLSTTTGLQFTKDGSVTRSYPAQ